MSHPSEQALREIQTALSAQNERFASVVDAFNDLPPGVRLNVSPAVFEALEASTSTQQPHTLIPPRVGALRA